MNEEGKQGSFKGIVVVMMITIVIASLWNSVSWIKDFAHAILGPTLGVLLDWNMVGGMVIIILAMSLITTLTQKYGTDQKTIREMKQEQKALQEEMKTVKEHPEKLMELQKKQFEFLPRMMKLSMRPIIYTSVPFVLLFRWFMDFFTEMGDPRFFGMTWFWFYLLGTIFIGTILRKTFKVV